MKIENAKSKADPGTTPKHKREPTGEEPGEVEGEVVGEEGILDDDDENPAGLRPMAADGPSEEERDENRSDIGGGLRGG